MTLADVFLCYEYPLIQIEILITSCLIYLCVTLQHKLLDLMQDQGFKRNMQGDTREMVYRIRDKFEYDREKRMRDKGTLNLFKLLISCSQPYSMFW